jgi:hypothetical protein
MSLLAPAFDQDPQFDAADRRAGPRHISILRVGKICWDDEDQLCIVRNISAGGLMVGCNRPPPVDQRVTVELRSDKQMPGTVRWNRDGNVGIQLDCSINIEAVLREERNPLLRIRPRAPRFLRRGTVKLIGEGEPVLSDIIDISIGGLSCRPERPLRRGEPVVASVQGLVATTAEIRWTKGDVTGVRFEKPLPWRAFGDWLDAAPRT